MQKLKTDTICKECGFELWHPIAKSTHSVLGLYNDARFPGRCILKLTKHYEDFSELPACLRNNFMADIVSAQNAISKATGAERVNIAILGNRVSHVHAHLIPRFPKTEKYPDCSPWNDPREKTSLSDKSVEELKAKILDELS